MLLSVHITLAAEIHQAVESESIAKVVELLAKDPKSVNAQNAEGATPLHLAAGLNNKAIINLLIGKGADINISTKHGWTPLHWAAHMNAADAVVILMGKGADAQAKAHDGKTPLQVAIAEKAQAVAAILAGQTKAVYTDNSLDASFALAVKAQAGGDLKEAYELFNKLVNEDPKNEKYNFALGMTCLSLKDYSRAQFAFDRVLAQNPQNGRARVELARAMMGLGQDSQAKQEFEKVLRSNPPPEVKRNIDAHIKEIMKRVNRWQFSGRIDAGVFHDDNVNVGPDSERISIAPIIFGSQSIDELTVQQASKPAKSKGYSGSIAANAVYDAGASGKWLWSTAAAYYQNKLADRPENESIFFQVDAGPRYLAERGYLEAPVRMSHISTGGNPLVNMYGCSPVFIYAYGAEGEWRFGTLATFERRDYAKLNDRDGFFASVGEVVRHYYGVNRNSIMMGLTITHDFTKEAVYEYTGREWLLGMEFNLPWKIVAYGRIKYVTATYAEREILSPADRKDDQRQYTIGLSKMITSRWGVDGNYQVSDNTSTFALYQYDRHVATLSTFCTF